MKAFLLALCMLPMLASCVATKKKSTEYPDGRKEEEDSLVALGGKGAKTPKGIVWNNEKSFRDGAIMVGTLATSYFGAVTTQAAEATNQVALKEATRKHVSDNALKGKAIEANAAAHGAAIQAEVPGIVPAVAPPAITP